jgi:hypothetical protein
MTGFDEVLLTLHICSTATTVTAGADLALCTFAFYMMATLLHTSTICTLKIMIGNIPYVTSNI